MTDRGYLNLLSHLTRSTTNLPLPTIQGSIAHYLAHIHPSPTPLAATVVSSPFFRHASHERLDGLATALRHAVHVKVKVLKDEPGGVFTRSVSARVAEWVGEVLNGLQGGVPLLRLTCYTGLVQGLEDWDGELKAKGGWMRRRVEEEFVVALAEVMDQLTATSSTGWEKEFTREAKMQSDEGMLQLTFLVIARSMPLVAHKRLRALPLASLIRLLLSSLNEAFEEGTFLRAFTAQDTSLTADHPGVPRIHALSKSMLLTNMSSLSRMCSQLLTILADSRPDEAWSVMEEMHSVFIQMSRTVQADWLKAPFSHIVTEDELDPRAREVATATWLILKTMLFTTIRLTQSILNVVVYTPQPRYAHRSSLSRSASPSPSSSRTTPFAFALRTLHIFSNLSFTLPQFGGVSSAASEGGFVELKRVFYTALDVLAAGELESARFVHELRESMEHSQARTWPQAFWGTKKAYALACAEQLAKVLNEDSIRNDVYPLVEPHLNAPSHRETFESAHSVMLAILAAHAQKAEQPSPAFSSQKTENEKRPQSFAEQAVPFYTQCLIDNSSPGKLTRVQLRLAYRALVRSASTMQDGDAFAWYCVDSLLRASQSVSNAEHRQSMYLALVASVPSVNLPVLPRVLDAVLHDVLEPLGEQGGREEEGRELVGALFEEISERVGDECKEFAMRWWNANKESLRGLVGGTRVVGNVGNGKEREIVSRL